MRTGRRWAQSPAPRGTTGRRDPTGGADKGRFPPGPAAPRPRLRAPPGPSAPRAARQGLGLEPPDPRARCASRPWELARPRFKPPARLSRSWGTRAAAPHPTRDSPTAAGARPQDGRRASPRPRRRRPGPAQAGVGRSSVVGPRDQDPALLRGWRPLGQPWAASAPIATLSLLSPGCGVPPVPSL